MLFGQGPVNGSVDIAAASDLPGFFVRIGTVLTDSTGAFLYDDADNPTSVKRFYRLTSPSLVVNGDFETGPYAQRGGIAGWAVSGTGHISANAEGATGGTHSAAFSEAGDFQGDVLGQVLMTTPGKSYSLDFEAGIFGVKTGNLQLQVQLTGLGALLDQKITPPYPESYQANSIAFQHYHYTFTADSSLTALQFTDVGLGNANADLVLDTVTVVELSGPAPSATPGPPMLLHVSSINPRYLVNGLGKPVFLTGSHTWLNLQDFSTAPVLDYGAYLELLSSLGHNFIRLWQLDRPYTNLAGTPLWGSVSPLPFARTGPGYAADQGLKYDLAVFDQSYFERLRDRVQAARDRGIYVSIMLFDPAWVDADSRNIQWQQHPFNPDNNVNALNLIKADLYTLNNQTWVGLMDKYVDKVIETVGDLDNVLYEVGNEGSLSSRLFQYHVINRIHAVEASRAKQHPVGMTAYDGLTSDATSNTDMLNGPADWYSPSGRVGSGYTTNVIDAVGSKASLLDTDHIWGIDPAGDDSSWAWKCLTRGHNPIMMDPFNYIPGVSPDLDLRAAMGYARKLADRIDLLRMNPADNLSSTGYVLANPGVEYVVYQPVNAAFSVQLPAATFRYEWIDPATGATSSSGSITATGPQPFSLPAGFSKGGVLYLKADAGTRSPTVPP